MTQMMLSLLSRGSDPLDDGPRDIKDTGRTEKAGMMRS